MLTVILAGMLSEGTDEMLSDGMANFSYFPNVSFSPNFPGSGGVHKNLLTCIPSNALGRA